MADLTSDPQMLAVSPRNFAEHLEVLHQMGSAVPLTWFSSGRTSAPSKLLVGITFDDGYADNLYEAKPLLNKFDQPAMFFVATQRVSDQTEFWWDELASLILLNAHLPNKLELSVGDTTQRWDSIMNGREHFSSKDYLGWVVTQEPPTPRHSLYLDLVSILRRTTPTDIEGILAKLRAWTGTNSHTGADNRPLDLEELRVIGSDPSLEIGAHTVNHSSLTTLSPAEQAHEISGSKEFLEMAIGRPVTSFAYPFGTDIDYSDATVRIVKDAGFSRACTTSPAQVTNQSNPFLLPRLIVRNWNGDHFENQIRNWLDA